MTVAFNVFQTYKTLNVPIIIVVQLFPFQILMDYIHKSVKAKG